MSRFFVALVFFFATFLVAARPALAVNISWTPVGNPGNAADTADGDGGTPGVQQFGAVGYSYSIGTYEVTNNQYVEFLNAKDATGANPLDLYYFRMGQPLNQGGIAFNSGAPNGSKYSVISGSGNHPVVWVTWYDTLRFANWLNNGQGSGDTESGAYTLLGGTPTPSNAASITRNPEAKIVLPNENEWYKAAYFNGTTSSYFQYPTSSNTSPTSTGPTSNPNSSNLFGAVLGLTDVGVYSGTTSPSGAFDMAGNAWELNETFIGGQTAHGLRGSAWDDGFRLLEPWWRATDATVAMGDDSVGFRVAMIPEPSTGVLAVLAFGMMWAQLKRQASRQH
jgi:sulfatase modifying factor 1